MEISNLKMSFASVTNQLGWFAGGTRFLSFSRSGVALLMAGWWRLATDGLQAEEDLFKSGIILPCSDRPLEAVEGTGLGDVSVSCSQDRALLQRHNTALNYLFRA